MYGQCHMLDFSCIMCNVLIMMDHQKKTKRTMETNLRMGLYKGKAFWNQTQLVPYMYIGKRVCLKKKTPFSNSNKHVYIYI